MSLFYFFKFLKINVDNGESVLIVYIHWLAQMVPSSSKGRNKMKAQDISVSSMKSYTECYDAIDAIENDYRNTRGGITAWMSGYTTYLTATAQKKVDALKRKANSFPCNDDEE